MWEYLLLRDCYQQFGANATLGLRTPDGTTPERIRSRR
jgi:hypothetical protein